MSGLEGMRASLLGWYRRHHRRLPWRETADPYAVWVAETMLQQTRSETVVGYYRRFLARFPNLAALACAPESAVLAQWSGLGYYARARNLRRAAQQVVSRHGGRLPSDPAALRALPGVGRYTAGAIASIAFGARAAVLDGNVARVLSRHFRVAGSRRSASVERRLWSLAEELLPRRSSGDWNQALMELGATICRPRAPACARCPWEGTCAAHRGRRVERFPEPARRATVRRVRRACVVLGHDDRLLLVRRNEGRLLRGLWEFPSVAVPEGRSPRALARELLEQLGARASTPRFDGTVEHTIMNERIGTHVFAARTVEPIRTAGGRWFRPRDLGSLPLSALGLRIAGLRGGFTDKRSTSNTLAAGTRRQEFDGMIAGVPHKATATPARNQLRY